MRQHGSYQRKIGVRASVGQALGSQKPQRGNWNKRTQVHNPYPPGHGYQPPANGQFPQQPYGYPAQQPYPQPYQPPQHPYGQQPHGYTPAMPYAQPNPYTGAPNPHPPSSNDPNYGRANPRMLAVFIAIIVGYMALVGGGMAYLVNDGMGGHYFANGAQVTPNADNYTVYVKDRDLAGRSASDVHCTATSGGDKVSVAASDHNTISRGSRSSTTKYWAVAELPTDKGPLTVNCTDASANPTDLNDLYLARPSTASSSLINIGIVAFVVLIIAMFGMVKLINRDYYRRHLHNPR